jgi:hypothetical protein
MEIMNLFQVSHSDRAEAKRLREEAKCKVEEMILKE